MKWNLWTFIVMEQGVLFMCFLLQLNWTIIQIFPAIFLLCFSVEEISLFIIILFVVSSFYSTSHGVRILIFFKLLLLLLLFCKRCEFEFLMRSCWILWKTTKGKNFLPEQKMCVYRPGTRFGTWIIEVVGYKSIGK